MKKHKPSVVNMCIQQTTNTNNKLIIYKQQPDVNKTQVRTKFLWNWQSTVCSRFSTSLNRSYIWKDLQGRKKWIARLTIRNIKHQISKTKSKKTKHPAPEWRNHWSLIWRCSWWSAREEWKWSWSRIAVRDWDCSLHKVLIAENLPATTKMLLRTQPWLVVPNHMRPCMCRPASISLAMRIQVIHSLINCARERMRCRGSQIKSLRMTQSKVFVVTVCFFFFPFCHSSLRTTWSWQKCSS